MAFGKKYGRKEAAFHTDTKGRTYYKLSELVNGYEADHVFVIDCMYINNGKYGEQAVVGVTDASGNFMVNLPGHLTSDVRTMLQDAEAVEDIRAGRAGFRIYKYTPKGRSNICYSVEWCDADLPF